MKLILLRHKVQSPNMLTGRRGNIDYFDKKMYDRGFNHIQLAYSVRYSWETCSLVDDETKNHSLK